MGTHSKDIRWKQRYSSFSNAFSQLQLFLSQTKLNVLEEQGLIQAFEYTYELAWKTLQDIIHSKGYHDITGPRPVIEQSFQDGLIEDGALWMKMFQDRNLTTHTYDQKTTQEIIERIRGIYFDLFLKLHKRLKNEK